MPISPTCISLMFMLSPHTALWATGQKKFLPLHLDPLMYATYVILAATPTAGVTAIFAQQYQRDTSASRSSRTAPVWS